MADHDEQDVRGDEDPELTEALSDALGDEPRAHELRNMKRVLSERRAGLSADLDHAEDDKEREALRRQLMKLDEQIAILAEEAEITKFVEDAVRVGIEMRRWGT
jgi:uncharacterized membrane protein YgaE (UPF0421/DUF939 family)